LPAAVVLRVSVVGRVGWEYFAKLFANPVARKRLGYYWAATIVVV
jgi:hypothetical protein